MSRLFGDLRQIGIVVRDIESAMKHWVEVCGVGPWFYTDKLAVTEFSYRDKRYDGIHISIALANSPTRAAMVNSSPWTSAGSKRCCAARLKI